MSRQNLARSWTIGLLGQLSNDIVVSNNSLIVPGHAPVTCSAVLGRESAGYRRSFVCDSHRMLPGTQMSHLQTYNWAHQRNSCHDSTSIPFYWRMNRSYSRVFDIETKAAQRSRAARFCVEHDPLQDEVASRVVERIEDCSRRFKDVLILGGSGFQVAKHLVRGNAGLDLRRIVFADHSEGMLERCREAWQTAFGKDQRLSKIDIDFHLMNPTSDYEDIGLLTDEGLICKPFDVAISCLGLHWVNDIPVCLMCFLSLYHESCKRG